MGYARAAQVPLEILIDDEAVLPNNLPSNFNLARYKRKHCAPAPLRPPLAENANRNVPTQKDFRTDTSMSSFEIMRWVVGGV